MASHYCNVISKKSAAGPFSRRARRGAVALEFAILAFPFFLWLLFIFELSYDLFTQEALDGALQAAIRQIEIGNAQHLSGGGAFIGDYLCGAAKGLLECDKMWVNVTPITPAPETASLPVTPTTQVLSAPDFSSFTTGGVPMNGDALNLANYTNISNGNATPGSTTPPPNAFCNAGGSQAILVSVVYIGPSFIGGMLPGLLSAKFNGTTVHPTLSTAGFVTEAFPAGATPANTTVAKACA